MQIKVFNSTKDITQQSIKSRNNQPFYMSLISYLSQIVMIESDKILSERKKEYNDLVSEIKIKTQQIKTLDGDITQAMIEYKKRQKLYKVLGIIDTLKKEGLLIGRNKTRILETLSNIRSLSHEELVILEDKISFYLPDKYHYTGA